MDDDNLGLQYCGGLLFYLLLVQYLGYGVTSIGRDLDSPDDLMSMSFLMPQKACFSNQSCDKKGKKHEPMSGACGAVVWRRWRTALERLNASGIRSMVNVFTTHNENEQC
jgi:hypothetical protein